MPKISTCNNRKGIARLFSYLVRTMSIARQQVAKHIPAEANTWNNKSIARQQHGKHAWSTIQAVLYMGSMQSGYKRVKL
jgi:hypothetical protein